LVSIGDADLPDCRSITDDVDVGEVFVAAERKSAETDHNRPEKSK
jgi:hypothetical protein